MDKHIYKCILLIAGLVISAKIDAQNLPSNTTRPTATAIAIPSSYSTSTVNFIRTWQPNMPITDTALVTMTGKTTAEVKVATQYIDGLGRPAQTVWKGISPTGKDLVAPVIYDASGREQYKYLPYVQPAGIPNGSFKLNPFNSQDTFYKSAVLNPGTIGESIYYYQTDYESSPLNRVLKSYMPGNSWAKEGGNHPTESRYEINTIADSVRIWELGGTFPTTTATYPGGKLYKVVHVDENGNQSIEYSDTYGQLILKKKQLSATPGTAHIGWLCTYYIYDDLGNVRFVIPPLAVEKSMTAATAWDLSLVADELCFQYQYDSRNRTTAKKMPGAGTIYFVYDIRDRLAFTQDAIQRTKNPQEWVATFYDELDRTTMTAIYKANTTQAALQASLNTAASTAQSISYTFPGTADIVLANYDGSSNYTATNSITMQDGFDSGAGAEFIAEINPSATGGSAVISATVALPAISAADLTPLTYTFYDNYNFAGAASYQTGDLGKLQSNANPYVEALPASPNMVTNGLITGTRVRVLDTDKWLTGTAYYNNKGRLIQAIVDNNVDGKDVLTALYDFRGKTLSTYLNHTNPRSMLTPKTTLQSMLGYDFAGRLLNIKKRLNDDSTLDKTIEVNSYTELGQLKQKRLGVTGTTAQIDSLTYTYTINGWLQAINKVFVNTAGSSVNWFGEELNVDYGFTTRQFNGNIAGAKWKSKSDGTPRAFGYTYDKVNRLTAADYTQQNTAGAAWTQNQMDFSVSNLTYDANGNINSMIQKGMAGTLPRILDDLKYTYRNNTNVLLSVADSSNTRSYALGDFLNGSNTGNDYSYDLNGNLLSDANKNISSITYNYLNLPAVVKMKGKGTITYQYDANGNKQKKTVVDSTVAGVKTTVTDYAGILVYKQDSLELISHEDGRIRPVYRTGLPVSYAYDYFENDHLGNVRLILTDQTDFSMYSATLETAAATTETATFSNIEETRTEKPAGYPQGETTLKNEFVSKLNAKAGGNKIGPSLVLKVMAGDTIQVKAQAFYKSQGPKDRDKHSPVNDIANGLLQVLGSNTSTGSVHNGVSGAQGSPFNTELNNNNYQRLKEKDADATTAERPKAYLNIVLFDEQFKMVEDNSSVRRVKNIPDSLQALGLERMAISKSGFLYVYTSNETEQDVYFDNVNVALTSGPLLEENHYYPFGLAMAGISSNVLKGTTYPQNRSKFNQNELQSKEFSDNSGLELYDFNARTYDAQIGKFYQIDPLTEAADEYSPYAFCKNNPILFNDFSGLSSDSSGPKGITLPEVVVTAPMMSQRRAIRQAQETVFNINTSGILWPSTRSNQGSGNGSGSTSNARISPLPTAPNPPVPPPSTTINPPAEVAPAASAIAEAAEETAAAARVLPMAGGAVMTFVLTVWPSPIGYGSSNVPTPFFPPKPYPGHGNRKDNNDPHIVYMFTYIPTDGKTPVLKYGISDVYRNGFDRPDSQEAALIALYGPTVKQTILTRTVNRAHALFIERSLVTKHVVNWGEMPREQISPRPF